MQRPNISLTYLVLWVGLTKWTENQIGAKNLPEGRHILKQGFEERGLRIPVAQLPRPAALDVLWTHFTHFPWDQRNKICSVKTVSASGQQMRRVSEFYLLLFWFFFFSFFHPAFGLKEIVVGWSGRGRGKANKSWLLLNGWDLAVVWRSQCSVSVSLHSPELYPVMYLFIITDGQKFFFPFSLFCPRPQGSDRDQQCSRSDEAARQKLN